MKKYIFYSIIATFILIELSLRIFAPIIETGTVTNYKYDETLGIKYKNNLRSVVLKDYIEETITNKFGTVNYQNDFSKYDKIIFSIGDSNTMGAGVQFDESYPFQMYLELNNGLLSNDFSYGVVNLGIQASGTIAALIIYEIFKSKISRPDYVTHLGTSNDYRDDLYFESGKKHSHLIDGSPRLYGYGGKINFIISKIEFLKRLKLIYSSLRYVPIKIGSNLPDKFEIFKKGFDEKTSHRYLEFNEKSNKENFKFILSWSGDSNIKNPCDKSYYYIKEWAQKNNIYFADWCSNYKKIHKKIPELTSTNNHSAKHYKTWVNKIISNSFAEKIFFIENN